MDVHKIRYGNVIELFFEPNSSAEMEFGKSLTCLSRGSDQRRINPNILEHFNGKNLATILFIQDSYGNEFMIPADQITTFKYLDYSYKPEVYEKFINNKLLKGK
jgi:hypothetical protein